MEKNSQDFINLISCFLNSTNPENRNYDWLEIYNLAKINDVVAIIAQEIKSLRDEYKPQGKLKSNFNQYLGLTLSAYYNKLIVKEELQRFLEYNNVDCIFVKGIEISKFYPQPEFRTSSDIDIIVREEKYQDVCNLFKKSNYVVNEITVNTLILNVQDVKVEVHIDADVYSKYFENIFSMCTNSKNEYKLDGYSNLMYIILHIVKHIKYSGVGIRMFMDVDACVRSIDDFDEEKLIEMCERAGVKKCSQMILSLCNFWFNTPVKQYFEFEKNKNLVDLFEKSFIKGGTFGFKNSNLGTYYINLNAGEKVGFNEKIKAVFTLIFPPTEAIKNSYSYSSKHKILIPFAYINRLYDGIFKRGIHSINTAKQIFASTDEALIESQVRKELEI